MMVVVKDGADLEETEVLKVISALFHVFLPFSPNIKLISALYLKSNHT